MATMDWEQEGSAGFTIYPEGTYKVRINTWERVTAGTGTKQIRWHGQILAPKQFINGPITEHTPLTEKSLWRCARLVQSCGIDLKRLGRMDTDSAAFAKALDMCKGKTTYWHLTVGATPKGARRNEIDDYQRDTEAITPDDENIPDNTGEEVPSFLKE